MKKQRHRITAAVFAVSIVLALAVMVFALR